VKLSITLPFIIRKYKQTIERVGGGRLPVYVFMHIHMLPFSEPTPKAIPGFFSRGAAR
jgi:hypothetical protein